MLVKEFDSFRKKDNPSLEDYKTLVAFTSRVMRQLKKERTLRSKLSKKNKKLVDRLGSLYVKEKEK